MFVLGIESAAGMGVKNQFGAYNTMIKSIK